MVAVAGYKPVLLRPEQISKIMVNSSRISLVRLQVFASFENPELKFEVYTDEVVAMAVNLQIEMHYSMVDSYSEEELPTEEFTIQLFIEAAKKEFNTSRFHWLKVLTKAEKQHSIEVTSKYFQFLPEEVEILLANYTVLR